MRYSEFAELYESLGETSKRLEKEIILSSFLKKLAKKGKSEWVYLLRGRVRADYDPREFGISGQLVIKVISKSFGIGEEKVVEKFRKIGDLGEVAESFVLKKRQGTLFSEKLSVDKVFSNLRKLMEIEGKGSVDRKLGLIAELLSSASGKEAKYIVRTLLNDLRIGVQDGTLRDSIALAFFGEEDKKEMSLKVEEAFDLSNDSAAVFDAARKGKKALNDINIIPGRALNVMLPVKVTDMDKAFEIVGRPAALEHKYDGFRVIISKSNDGEVKLFTRKLEEVTKQFPDVVSVVKTKVKGRSFVLDSEVVGFDSKTGRYMPFESISQRIRRKYDIDRLIAKLPVEINVFDVLFYDGKNYMDLEFKERRKLIEKIIKEKDKKIRVSEQIVTGDDEKAEKFYLNALKIGEEGVMFKALDKSYRQGRRVGYMVKMKPEVNDLDLVIVGAESGTGKRGGWLTSYIVAVRNGEEGKFLEVGKVSSGLKELESEGTTYAEMTKLLKPLIIEKKGTYVKVKPKLVVSVTYQNIQKSPSYDSGFAMRFPRITAYRPERDTKDIATLKDIEKEAEKKERK
ncbi:DNA ligase [Candidatus Pacearchaeota archaeon]|nr:DNA ligase [Candidatus Pacearchaeota archaeon]|tara:strand:+ start:2430 stop:4136 length:1707 start_codon:yes stop_codon:yes gene_type:complete